jgi:hypothetical protein
MDVPVAIIVPLSSMGFQGQEMAALCHAAIGGLVCLKKSGIKVG